MRFLLTGGSGFLGRYFLSFATSRGHEVLSLARRELGLPGEILWNFRSPVPSGLSKCDAVIHLAANVDFSTDFSPETYIVNALSTLHLAHWASVRNIPLILASMAGIHGAAEVAGPGAPEVLSNNYSVSKLIAEETVQALCSRAAILRIGGIYGLGGPSHLGLNEALTNAFEHGRAPVLYGDGAGQRNYIWVEDMAHWLLHVAENPPERKGEPIYAAGPEIMSIRGYLEAIVEMLGPNFKLERRSGSSSRDNLVLASPAPVVLTPFRSVLARYRAAASHEGVDQNA